MPGTAAPNKTLLNVQELAEYLGVTVNWCYEHSSGNRLPQIPSFKLGKYRRFRLDEIERWLAQGAQGAGRAA